MPLFQHTVHPQVAARAAQGPVTLAPDRMSLNDRVAARLTQWFGTMWTFYAFALYGVLGAIVPRFQAVLLYWSNWAQMWALPLLMVGAVVLGRATERRNKQQFDDTEAIFHGHQQIAEHQTAQDQVLAAHGELLKKIAEKVGVEIVEQIAEGHL